jgi:hypothetical protein
LIKLGGKQTIIKQASFFQVIGYQNQLFLIIYKSGFENIKENDKSSNNR